MRIERNESLNVAVTELVSEKKFGNVFINCFWELYIGMTSSDQMVNNEYIEIGDTTNSITENNVKST